MEVAGLAELLLRVTDRAGLVRTLNPSEGAQLMPVLRDQVDVTIGTCGGELSCGTCLVLLDQRWAGRLPEPGEDERELLEALGAAPDARLACQIALPAGVEQLALTVAPEG